MRKICGSSGKNGNSRCFFVVFILGIKLLLEIYWYYSFKLLLFHDYNLGL